jgi:hypothetical protein
MGPKIIKALEQKGTIVAQDAAVDPAAKAETVVARPTNASRKSDRSVATRTSDDDGTATKVERPERRAIGKGTVIAGSALALGVVAMALAFRHAQGSDVNATTRATLEARDAAAQASATVSNPSEDVALVSASSGNSAQVDASIAMNDDSSITTPSLVAQELNERPGRRANALRGRTITAGQGATRETTAATSVTTSNAGATSATETSSSRRQTHAATTYEP